MGTPPPQRPLLLLQALTLALLLQVDLASAMSKGKRRDSSLHRDIDHFVTADGPSSDEWYSENVSPTAEAPWCILRTDCLLVPEEERFHSSVCRRIGYEDKEIEPQLVPHFQGDSTGGGLHSWLERERPLWSTESSAKFDDMSNLHSAIGDSSYRDDMSLDYHSLQGATSDWLSNDGVDGDYVFPRNLENSAHALPQTWYRSTPHVPVSLSDKLLDSPSPSDINGQSKLHQMWNERKQWKTLGSISRNCEKHYHYRGSSDEQEDDHKSWEETLEDPEYSDWTYGKPSHVLAWNGRNHHPHEGCSCGHKHDVSYHGIGEIVDTEFKNKVEEPAEIPRRIEVAPGRKGWHSEPFAHAVVPIEELYRKEKPEHEQHSTEWDYVSDGIQTHKVLVHSENFPVQMDELPQKTETVPDGEKLHSVPLDRVAERHYPKEKDEWGHYISRCKERLGDVNGRVNPIHSYNFAAETDDTKLEVDEHVGSEPYEPTSVEVFRDMKDQADPVHSNTFDAETDETKVGVIEHMTSEPHDPTRVDNESVGNRKLGYEALEPRKCSKNLVESANIPSEETVMLQTAEFTSEKSKWDSEVTDRAISSVGEFSDMHQTVNEKHNTEWDDDPAALQTHKNVTHPDNFPTKVSDMPWSIKALSGTEEWEAEPEDRISDHVAVSYDKQQRIFGHRVIGVKNSFDSTKIYDGSLHNDKFSGEAGEVSWQAEVDNGKEKWNTQPSDQVSIYADESYGNRKWEQYAEAWKDMIGALKSHEDMVQSENFAGQVAEEPWKMEQTAREEKRDSDSFDQVKDRTHDFSYKPMTAWSYYSDAWKGESGTSAATYPVHSPGFAAKEAEMAWKSGEIPEEETPDNGPWDQYTVLCERMKTESHPVHVDGSVSKALDLKWGSGEESEYESFDDLKVQSHEAHGNQKVAPEHHSSDGEGAIENQDLIDSKPFPVEAAEVPWGSKVVHGNEMNLYGTFVHAGGATDGSFRIQRPFERTKPITWGTVTDETSYKVHDAHKPQWGEHVQQGVLAADETEKRTVPLGLPTARFIYDADASARGEWNLEVRQSPQKQQILYDSHDMKPTTHCEDVIISNSRTDPWRSKADSSRTAKKWREGVEDIVLPFEWPTKKNFARVNMHHQAISNHYTGRSLYGVGDLTGEADEHSWTVDNRRSASEEWSDDSPLPDREFSSERFDSPELSSSAEQSSGQWSVPEPPLPSMVQRLFRFFAEPIKKAACYVRKNWREGKAAEGSSRAEDTGHQTGTGVPLATPSQLRPSPRQRVRGRLRGLLDSLVSRACRRDHTTVEITMPDD